MNSSAMVLLALATSLSMAADTGNTPHPGAPVAVSAKSGSGGYLGVSIQDMTRDLAKAMEVKTTEGALVTEVMDDSPAGKAGLKEDDIIVGFDGSTITDADDLRTAVRKTKPGTSVSLSVVRKGETKKLTAEVGKAPKSTAVVTPHAFSYGPGHAFAFFSDDSPKMGMRLRELTEQLGLYFQAPNGRGVLVEEVEKESAGEKAGIKAGDVLIAIGGSAVEDMRDVRRALRDRDEGEKIDLTVLRRGAKQSLTLTVEETDGDVDYWMEAPKASKKMKIYKERYGDFDNELRQLELELRNLNEEL